MTVAVDNAGLAMIGSGWTPVLVTGALLVVMRFVLSRTRFGQYTYAIGENAQSAMRAGINVRRHLLIIYLISAAIAAVVIGGASLFGGTGNVVGTLIGTLIIAVIQFGLVFINVDAFWQFIVVGVVIVLLVLMDQYKDRIGGAQ